MSESFMQAMDRIEDERKRDAIQATAYRTIEALIGRADDRPAIFFLSDVREIIQNCSRSVSSS